jgi:L-ascorbate metabolism protein UlaG (beta-lactamase superfamily)
MTRTTRWLLTAALAAAAWAVRDIPRALGGRPDATMLRRSPQYSGDRFVNTEPRTLLPPDSMRKAVRELVFGKQPRRPAGPVPLVRTSVESRPGGMYLTWYGHSSALVELDGARVLFDPVWSDRVSPSRLVGPRRLHEPPVPLDRLPKLDAIVISHDHYDHLDLGSVRTLLRTQSAPFLVPLGVAAHLRRWRVPESRIVELDWTGHADIAGLRITATPARHFSGRGFRNDGTLWASWVVAGPTRKVFYTGDSGYFPGYAEIGREHGPFDLSLVQIGAYAPTWPDIHMTPEQGVAAHLDVQARVLVPVHWATFRLAMHAWTEPADRLWREAKAHDVKLAVPRPGERIDIDDPPRVDGWWQTLTKVGTDAATRS